MHRRQSPISSRKRSITTVRSLGTTRVAACCSRRNSSRLDAARGSRSNPPSSVTGSCSTAQRAKAPIASPSSRRAPEAVALPERDRAGDARGGRDDHAVARDLLDPPRRGAEQEDLAGARLVDHLLVELADAAAVRKVDRVEAAVGDRARVGDRQRARALARADRAGHAVPDDARAQLAELLATGSARRACRARSRAARARARRRCTCGQAAPRGRRRPGSCLGRSARQRPSPRPPRSRRSRRSAARARRAGCAGRRSSRSGPRACAARPRRTRAGRRGTSGRCGPWTCRRRCGRRGRCAAGRR